MLIGRVLQPALKVAERILVRHQFDESFPAIRVEPLDFLARHRRGVFPDHAMIPVGKRVLHVQFEMVDLPLRQFVDELEQRFHRRHFVAADVQHHAAHREVRPIFNFSDRHFALPADLAQGHLGIELPGVIGGFDLSVADPVALRRKGRVGDVKPTRARQVNKMGEIHFQIGRDDWIAVKRQTARRD